MNDTTLVDPQLETWWTSLGVKDFEGESEQLLYKLATGTVYAIDVRYCCEGIKIELGEGATEEVRIICEGGKWCLSSTI